MGYHPFELIRLVSAHTRTTAEGSSVLAGGRPEWILDQVTMPITPPSRPPSVSVHSTSLSLAFALQGFFPQQIVILSQQASGHHAAASNFSSNYYYSISSQPSHHMVGHYNRYKQKVNQFFLANFHYK